MPTISEVIESRRYRIVSTNLKKRFIVLTIEGCHDCRLYVHFDWLPTRTLFDLTSGKNIFPDTPETCNEDSGGVYGRIYL
jgi:hypothetical protein